jgi:molecular chaperone DnaK
LESLQFSVQKHFDENKDKIPAGERQGLEDALKEARTVLDSNREATDAELFKPAFDRLEKASHKMAEALYKAAGGTDGAQASAGGAGAGAAGGAAGDGSTKKDDVIDAEYTEAPKNN